MAVLFDTLLHPNADFGYEFPPVLQWRLENQHHVPHLVLGRAAPGGAWHVSLSATETLATLGCPTAEIGSKGDKSVYG